MKKKLCKKLMCQELTHTKNHINGLVSEFFPLSHIESLDVTIAIAGQWLDCDFEIGLETKTLT